jgi:hypothetical protein
MKNAWGDDVEDHEAEDCPTCGGSGFYKLPYGAPDDGREIEDEDNCDCDCHSADGPR